MKKQTIEAFFPYPPERVWRSLTDPTLWDWPGGPAWVRESRDGRRFTTEDLDGTGTVFRVTAFAPPRWYAVEVENEKTAGRCEVLLFREKGGTRVECSADLYGKTPMQKLLLRLHLKSWQRECLEALDEEMRLG